MIVHVGQGRIELSKVNRCNKNKNPHAFASVVSYDGMDFKFIRVYKKRLSPRSLFFKRLVSTSL